VPWGTHWFMMLCRCREELHAAVGAAITGNRLSHVAAKATEAATPEAAEAATATARRVGQRPTYPYGATRGRSPDWLKMKKPACAAVTPKAEEDAGDGEKRRVDGAGSRTNSLSTGGADPAAFSERLHANDDGARKV
jgi:hypothetical protein